MKIKIPEAHLSLTNHFCAFVGHFIQRNFSHRRVFLFFFLQITGSILLLLLYFNTGQGPLLKFFFSSKKLDEMIFVWEYNIRYRLFRFQRLIKTCVCRQIPSVSRSSDRSYVRRAKMLRRARISFELLLPIHSIFAQIFI